MPKKLKIPPVMGLLQKNSRLKVHLVRFVGKSDLKMNEFELNNDDSRRISPLHSAIAGAFAKGNLYFLWCASANYCRGEIVLKVH